MRRILPRSPDRLTLTRSIVSWVTATITLAVFALLPAHEHADPRTGRAPTDSASVSHHTDHYEHSPQVVVDTMACAGCRFEDQERGIALRLAHLVSSRLARCGLPESRIGAAGTPLSGLPAPRAPPDQLTLPIEPRRACSPSRLVPLENATDDT